MSDFLVFVITQFIVLLASLTFHECAHAWTADKLGDPTARSLGRVSLNPIVHSDLFGTIIFPLVGAYMGFMFGWAKPVPVNVGNLRNPKRDHMLVAAAGPVSNLILAVAMFAVLLVLKAVSDDMAQTVLGVVYSGVPRGGAIVQWVIFFAFHMMRMNVILAIFNLIPIAPLDGAAVLSGFLPRNLAAGLDRLQAYSFMIFVIMLVYGVPSRLFNPPINFLCDVLAS